MTQEQAEYKMKDTFRHETNFCNEEGYEKNEHDVCIFVSKNQKQSINLPMVLHSYKQWLIEKGIVKEK